MNSQKQFNNKGLTLIELVVVLAVFSIIILATVTVFTSVVSQQRRMLQEQELWNQIEYVFSYMTRTASVSTKDSAGTCLGTAGSTYLLTHFDSVTGFYQGIKFLRDDGVCQEFFLDIDGVIKELKNAGTSQAILSSKFKV